MSKDSEYAQRQFLAQKEQCSRDEEVEGELRRLRRQVRDLELKVSSLTSELSLRNVIGEPRRGFS